jgi:hypothetical protein
MGRMRVKQHFSYARAQTYQSIDEAKGGLCLLLLCSEELRSEEIKLGELNLYRKGQNSLIDAL